MSATHTGEFRRPTPADAQDPDTRSPAHAGPAPATNAGRGYSIAGMVLGLGALIVLPILLGPAGIALGYVGHRKGDRLGRTAMIVAGIGMVAGFVIGFVLLQQMGGVPGMTG